jgi:hypothetical protein
MRKCWKRSLVAGGAVILPLLLLFLLVEAKAQSPEQRDLKNVQGNVESFTTAPRGEVDGAVLSDGTTIHWPPHLGDRITGIIAKGDQVRASGWMESGPAGDAHLEVQNIKNLRTGLSFDRPDAPPLPKPAPRDLRARPAPAETKTVEGNVQSLTTAPRGEVDGAVLDNGTTLHWPPHLGSQISNIAVKGDRIRAMGWMETGPEGDSHLEIQSITNLRTNDSFNRPGGSLSPRGGNIEERLRALEERVDQLFREVERLRKDR